MRKADPDGGDFHLLEELSRPRASLNAIRISIWVFRDGPNIREVILSGHAEGRTCAAATSRIIEAAKRLDERASWMLTCGAALFSIEPETPSLVTASGDDPFSADFGLTNPLLGLEQMVRGKNQTVMEEMVSALRDLGDNGGLVEVTERSWEDLSRFRSEFADRRGASPYEIVLPDPQTGGSVADYIPVTSDRLGTELVFALEGWDFDNPAFQAVADMHLRSVHLELLRDARQRRRIYRGWLKDWTERWAPSLTQLEKEQALEVQLKVPPRDSSTGQATSVNAPAFLADHAWEFLDKGQSWYRQLAHHLEHATFNRPKEKLDKQIVPPVVNIIDFERGVSYRRAGTVEDAYTPRERIVEHSPGMIATCLQHIRRMDAIIAPYENLRSDHGAPRGPSGPEADQKRREAQIVSNISRRIVIETMIRGWPSFYLSDQRDRDVFDAWAKDCRPHVWSLMTQQARQAGIAMEVLLEDNLVYDVRFNDDLGCTVRPLMLTDNASHAQLHGSGAGASVVVPLWPRHQTKELDEQVLTLARDNHARVQGLIRQAQQLTTGDAADVSGAVGLLRQALACHPAHAGRLILEEWAERLGRDTRNEFECARHIVTAAELCGHHRYEEAQPHVEEYLRMEPHPIADAYVLAGLGDLVGLDGAQRKFETMASGYNRLIGRLRDLLGEDPAKLTQTQLRNRARKNPDAAALLESAAERSRTLDRLQSTAEEQKKSRVGLIEEALADSDSVRDQHPRLAQAAAKAPELLRQVLDWDGQYAPGGAEHMHRRYGSVRYLVRLQALCAIVRELIVADHLIGKAPGAAPTEARLRVASQARETWVPKAVADDLGRLDEDLGRGSMDSLHRRLVSAILQEAIGTCLAEVQDCVTDLDFNVAPLAETIASQVHVAQIIDGHYKTALDKMLAAQVRLGRAIAAPWTVLDRETTDLPAGARLVFDSDTLTISVAGPDGQRPLLQAETATPEDVWRVEQILADPDVAGRISLLAPSLAEGVLCIPMSPQASWHLWREAMARLGQELIIAMSNFSFEAALIPELTPGLTEEGKEAEQRMDQLVPRDTPSVDWTWRDHDTWDDLLRRR